MSAGNVNHFREGMTLGVQGLCRASCAGYFSPKATNMLMLAYSSPPVD